MAIFFVLKVPMKTAKLLNKYTPDSHNFNEHKISKKYKIMKGVDVYAIFLETFA
jgi:hypothetical protein